MHPIKREILLKLILNPNQKFSQLKPQEIESNHFIYYLKQLINEGLVNKTKQQYALSEKGQHLASRISLKDLTVRLQPKTVTAPVCFRGDKVLLYKWKRQPGYGLASLVCGKLHFGESINEAAARELKEKTGLSANLKHVGSVYIREFKDNQATAHQLSHIFYGQEPTGKLTPTKVGEPIWVGMDELSKVDLLPGTKEILDIINEPPLFFKEFKFDV